MIMPAFRNARQALSAASQLLPGITAIYATFCADVQALATASKIGHDNC